MVVDNILEEVLNRPVLGRNALGNGSSTFLHRLCERVLPYCRDVPLNQSV
jgi:hypothetical protein